MKEGYIGDDILSSHLRIVINHNRYHKDPYETSSIMESIRGIFRGSCGLAIRHLIPISDDLTKTTENGGSCFFALPCFTHIVP